jgi:hypothetical protein
MQSYCGKILVRGRREPERAIHTEAGVVVRDGDGQPPNGRSSPASLEQGEGLLLVKFEKSCLVRPGLMDVDLVELYYYYPLTYTGAGNPRRYDSGK